jgi:hypothetical protein
MRPPRLSLRDHDRGPRQRRRRDVRPDLEALEGRLVLSLVAASGSDTQFSSASDAQTQPSVAMDANGDYVVAWSQGTSEYHYDVEATVYSSASGKSKTIDIASVTGVGRPSVAMDANGDFVVAWQVLDASTFYYGIQAQRYSVAGAALGSTISIGSGSSRADLAQDPKVAMDSAGDFTIAYEGDDGSDYGIFAQRFNSAGTAQGSSFGVNTVTQGDQVAETIAMDSAGASVIAWQNGTGDSATPGIYAQLYNSSGTAVGGNFSIDTLPETNGVSTPANPSVAMEPTGQFVVAWQYQQTTSGTGNGFQAIAAEQFSATGIASPNGVIHVSAPANMEQDYPSVAIDGNGNFVVAWGPSPQPGVAGTLLAQRFNASGTPIGDNGSGTQFEPSTQSGDNQIMPDVASDPAGDTWIIWQSSTGDFNFDSYGRLYNHVNNAPTISTPSNVTINENAGQQTVNLTDITTGSGKESETLTVTASSNNTALINPTVNYTSPNSTGTLTFTPAANTFGTATITLTVTDNGGTANGGLDQTIVQFTVTVNEVSIPPTINQPSNVTINENAGQQTVNLTGISTNGAGSETLTVTASSNNSALVNPTVNYTSPDSTGTLTFTPAANSYGTATITVTVKDSSGSTSVHFLVTVDFVNQAPTINQPSNVTINENAGEQTVNLTGISAGPGNPSSETVTVTASSNNSALINPSVAYTNPNSTGTLTFTPAANSYGTATITVTVMNSGGTSNGGVDETQVQFTVTVDFVNQAPTINQPSNVTINENAGEQTVNLTGITAGPGNASSETITVSASSNNSALINPSVTYTNPNSTGTLTFTPAANSYGTATITVTVMNSGGTSNGGADTTQVQFLVTVNFVNQAPTIDQPSNVTINENAGEQTVNLAGITAGPGNPSSETITVTASSNNSALINPSVTYTSPDSTGTLTFTPAANSYGTATITVTVMNSGGTSNGGVDETQVQFTATVNQVAATVTAVSADWGTDGTIALQTAADGLRLLPAGRTNDLPWYGINRLQITLSQPETLSPGDVSVTGIAVANYGPVTISGSGTNYTITFAQAIDQPDRVTVAIGNAGITSYVRRLDVLPGDVNDDGVVNMEDVIAIRNDSASMGAVYDIFDDIDGDGTVDTNDLNTARLMVGKTLPPLPPPA